MHDNATSAEVKSRIEEAQLLLKDSLTSAKTCVAVVTLCTLHLNDAGFVCCRFLATFVPARSAEAMPSLQDDAGYAELLSYRKDDAPYIYTFAPHPCLGGRPEDAAPRADRPSSSPVFQPAPAPPPTGFTVAPQTAQRDMPQMSAPAPSDRWNAGYGYDNRAGGVSFSAYPNQYGFQGQNKYAAGHGVYGHTGYGAGMYGNGFVGDMYQQQAYGHGGYDMYGRQQQQGGYQQQYRDPSAGSGTMPTATLQTFNSYPSQRMYGGREGVDVYNPTNQASYQQAPPGAYTGMYPGDSRSGMTMRDPYFGSGPAGAGGYGRGPTDYYGASTSFRNTQGWQPSSVPGPPAGAAAKEHARPQAAVSNRQSQPAVAATRGGAAAKRGTQRADHHHDAPTVAAPAKGVKHTPTLHLESRGGGGDDAAKRPVRYRIVSDAAGGVAEVKAATAAAAAADASDGSDDEWPLSMFSLALHRRDKKDQSDALDDVIREGGKGLVRNRQYAQMSVENALKLVDGVYSAPFAKPDDPTLGLPQQLLALQRESNETPATKLHGTDCGLWLTKLGAAQPEHLFHNMPIAFDWPDDTSEGVAPGTYLDKHRMMVKNGLLHPVKVPCECRCPLSVAALDGLPSIVDCVPCCCVPCCRCPGVRAVTQAFPRRSSSILFSGQKKAISVAISKVRSSPLVV